ncbi:hypothetical protein [Streptomyces sp. NPDC054834]
MRCVIARHPFGLTRTGVPAVMQGVRPGLVMGESVGVGGPTPLRTASVLPGGTGPVAV